MKFLCFALVALALASVPVHGAPVKLADLIIETPWARATPKGAAVGAGYLTIKNDGATADRLMGVAVDFATVQVHEMKMNNGVMEMRQVNDGLEVPAHGVVALKPGGYHLMFVALKHPLVKGETFKAMLTFAHAGQVAVAFPVMGVGAAGPAAKSHDMSGMKM
jgi:copper(I)-binding protein